MTTPKPLKVIVPAILTSLAILEALTNATWFRSYGDSGVLALNLEESKSFTRWLLGTTVLLDIWSFRLLMPGFSLSSAQFVSIVGAISMLIATLLLSRISSASVPVFLCLSSPIWIAFSLGYDEYYPFIAGIFMVYLLWIFDYLHLGRTGTALLLAILAVSYVGFSVFVFVGLVKVVIEYRSDFIWLKVLGLWGFFSVAFIEVCWGGGHTSFLVQLITDMNLGEVNTNWALYQGHAMSANLPFFEISYVFTSLHLEQVGKMILYGGGVGVVLCFIPFQRVGGQQTRLKLRLTKLEQIPIFLLVSYSALYPVFIIPKLGPVIDVDLFFSVDLALLFWSGDRIQKAQLNEHDRRKLIAFLGFVIIMVNLPLTYYLVIVGL